MYFKIIFSILLIGLLTACGGGSDTPPSTPDTTSRNNRATESVDTTSRNNSKDKKAWTHGKLSIDKKTHMLKHEDGTGFFWMGDTAWELITLKKQDIDFYLENRKNKNFTVIQSIAFHYHKSEANHKTPFERTELPIDISKPQEEYWKHVDYMLTAAEKRGLYVLFLPTWHDSVKAETFKTPKDATTFGTWIAKRYKNRPNIIWAIGGDTNVAGDDGKGKAGVYLHTPKGMSPEEEIAIWNALGNAIKKEDPNHLMTFHSGSSATASVKFNNPKWLDFNMIQSGRESVAASIDKVEKALKYPYALIDGETLYENFALSRRGGESGRATAYQIRNDTYSALFSGTFGHTYGHDSIYRFWIKTEAANCTGWACTPNTTWKPALDADGAKQMEFVSKLMQSRPIVSRVPDQSIVVGSPKASNGIIATRGKSYAMIYSAHGQDIPVEMGKISGETVKAWWYNPRTGKATKINTFSNKGTHTFNPKGEPSDATLFSKDEDFKYARDYQKGNDWILVLDDSSIGYEAPGK